MAGPKQEQQSSSEMAVLAVAVLVCIVCAILWLFYRAPVVYFVYALDLAQTELVGLVKGGLGQTGTTVRGVMLDTFNGTWEASRTNFGDMVLIMEAVGKQTNIVISLMIAAIAIYVLFRMKGEGYKGYFNLSQLAGYQSKHWKVALAGSTFDPLKSDRANRPAERPYEWMIANKVGLKNGIVDQESAERAYQEQLGDTYLGFAKLPIHHQALAVMFNLSRKRNKRTQKLKEDLAELWVMDSEHAVERTKELITPFVTDQKFIASIERIMGQHAYIRTAMVRLFQEAKNAGGVFATAEIRWLKPVDRTLWYSLHNVGRHAFFPESAAVQAHFDAERICGERLIEPYFDKVMEGLQDYARKHGNPDLESYTASLKVQD